MIVKCETQTIKRGEVIKCCHSVLANSFWLFLISVNSKVDTKTPNLTQLANAPLSQHDKQTSQDDASQCLQSHEVHFCFAYISAAECRLRLASNNDDQFIFNIQHLTLHHFVYLPMNRTCFRQEKRVVQPFRESKYCLGLDFIMKAGKKQSIDYRRQTREIPHNLQRARSKLVCEK